MIIRTNQEKMETWKKWNSIKYQEIWGNRTPHWGRTNNGTGKKELLNNFQRYQYYQSIKIIKVSIL